MEASAEYAKAKEMQRLEDAIFGNGKAGLNTRVTVIETRLEDIRKLLWTILSALVGLGIVNIWGLVMSQ